jgi:hypothetical protein
MQSQAQLPWQDLGFFTSSHNQPPGASASLLTNESETSISTLARITQLETAHPMKQYSIQNIVIGHYATKITYVANGAISSCA